MNSVDRQRRPYRMVARAEAFESTGDRIVAAAGGLFAALPYDQVSLEAIARDAGTSVQTVIRRFGAKDGVFAEVARRRGAQIRRGREAVADGDTRRALRVLVDQYERWGDEVLNLLAQETRSPLIGDVVGSGRRYHHAWVDRVFGPTLRGVAPAAARRAIQQLVAATDLYVWKILRRDFGLSPGATRAAMTGMVDGIRSQCGSQASP